MIHSPNHVTQLAVALLASSTHVDSEGMPINLAVYKPSLLQHGSVQVIHTLARARQQDQSASPSVLSPWVTLPVPHCQCFSSSLSHTKNYSVLQSRIMKLDWVVLILYIFPSFFFFWPLPTLLYRVYYRFKTYDNNKNFAKVLSSADRSVQTTTKMNHGEI